EDGIRDFHVTGVQTCALPISGGHRSVTASTTFIRWDPDSRVKRLRGWSTAVGTASGGGRRPVRTLGTAVSVQAYELDAFRYHVQIGRASCRESVLVLVRPVRR